MPLTFCVLAVIGLVVWLSVTLVPMPERRRAAIFVLGIVLTFLWLVYVMFVGLTSTKPTY